MDKLELPLRKDQQQKQELVPKQEKTTTYQTESEWAGVYHCMIDDAAFYKHPDKFG